MGSLGASGSGGLWGMGPFHRNIHRRRDKGSKPSNSSKDNAGQATTGADSPYNFPLKESATAASLVLAGDTIAQVRQKWVKHKASVTSAEDFKDIISSLFSEHDWIRALRMTSYGFLLYGPGSHAWYQYLDHCMPKKNVTNLMTKVLLNQIVLGPTVIGVIFAWNNLWLGKLAELPNKYQKDALPTLFYGFRFWIPVSLLNFWAVPLQTRVAFMSMASVFWNFYLSSTMSS
ncbi:Peroxisomal membrane 22 kDa (Mpv17/PMP22) family protein [Striga hermonthica]|uniref:Peroxisomal membrane 22 kDa (Mpv17/PMP22) family protein n=1 Tax=Striga hermonthica TaxID=68872 RepID=A0A9N7R3H4_STRHE|nr:Peroxisomal membrane 22 kDa (Mpv17/PMP22) family protein [Striga hermonthica]